MHCTFSPDGYPIEDVPAQFAGRCTICGIAFPVDTPILPWWGNDGRRAWGHATCVEQRDAAEQAESERTAVAKESAASSECAAVVANVLRSIRPETPNETEVDREI